MSLEETAVERLTRYLKRSERVKALARVCAREADAIMSALSMMRIALDPFGEDGEVRLTGAALELWGSLLREPRGTDDDAEYARIVGAKLLELRSSGTIGEVQEIAQRLIGAAYSEVVESYPMAITVYVYGGSPSSYLIGAVRRRLSRSLASGVQLSGVIHVPDDTMIFDDEPRGFDGAPMAELI